MRRRESMELLKWENNCVRCGHSWSSRKPTRPRNCARCKAIYWYRSARIPKHHGEPRPVGRPRKVDLEDLAVGQMKLIPHNILPGDYVDNRGIRISIGRFEKKTGRKFDIKYTYPALEVTRYR